MAKRKSKTTKLPAKSVQNKINLTWKNFTTFLILSVLSFILYSVSENPLFVNFFGILLIILGFLTFAFLIILIVLAILKKTGRR